MTRSRQSHQDGNQGSESSDEDSDERSPPRGRTGNSSKPTQLEEAQVDAQIATLMDENSKASGA
jgi:choline-phosphate cytidylyltransferase